MRLAFFEAMLRVHSKPSGSKTSFINGLKHKHVCPYPTEAIATYACLRNASFLHEGISYSKGRFARDDSNPFTPSYMTPVTESHDRGHGN